MMRNGINSYLTSLVMVLALLFSANAFAAETVQSTIEIDNNQYALYTGFTATAGSEAPSGYVLQNMVDGDLTTGWNTAPSVSEDYASRGYAYFEFSSDVPIVLKGYVLNSHRASGYHPTDRRLYAKANEDDEYALVSSYTNEDYSGTQNSFPIANEDNKPYRYFRFEGTNSVQHVWLHEIRLYGGRELTYVFMPKKSATCTATGIKQACYLRSDGKYFTDETGAADLSKEDVIEPLKPHNIIHHEEDDVYYERWQCSVCGKFFKNAEGTEEISDMVSFTKYRRVAVASEYRTLIQIMSSRRNDLSDQITGDIVSFVVAEKYIDVNSIKVSDGVNDYPITSEGNGYYSFTVPAANVTISAEKKAQIRGCCIF